jgi:hypothetical protein
VKDLTRRGFFSAILAAFSAASGIAKVVGRKCHLVSPGVSVREIDLSSYIPPMKTPDGLIVGFDPALGPDETAIFQYRALNELEPHMREYWFMVGRAAGKTNYNYETALSAISNYSSVESGSAARRRS